jgi:DNA-binding YbaB/EbfC family protein
MSSDLPGLGALFRQAQELQRRISEASEGAESRVLEGTAGGGVVRVRVTGEFEFQSVSIDPAVVAQGDVAVLEDLLLAALHDAVTQVEQFREAVLGDSIGEILSGMGLGFDLPSEGRGELLGAGLLGGSGLGDVLGGSGSILGALGTGAWPDGDDLEDDDDEDVEGDDEDEDEDDEDVEGDEGERQGAPRSVIAPPAPDHDRPAAPPPAGDRQGD